MKIPSKIRIGGITYRVLVVPEWDDGEGVDGETCYDKKHGNVIYIGEELTQEAKEITLLHEILHCCNSTINHEFLDSLSEQLYQVLKDNRLLKE